MADLYSDIPARFGSLREVWIEKPDHTREHLTIEESWMHQHRLVLKFAGTDSISAAERLSGAWVQLETSQAALLPEGTYFDHDLVGCKIVDQQGAILGMVKQILRLSGNTQLVVEGKNGEFMVPAVAEFCREVSVSEKLIRVNLPEGLIDLNE